MRSAGGTTWEIGSTDALVLSAVRERREWSTRKQIQGDDLCGKGSQFSLR